MASLERRRSNRRLTKAVQGSIKTPEHLEEKWLFYRVWIESGDSLLEIETKWSLTDLIHANDALDLKATIEEAELKKQKKK